MKDEAPAGKLNPQMETYLQLTRKPFEGTTNILRFNWPYYALALVIAVVGIKVLPLVPLEYWGPYLLLYLLVVIWTMVSLAVSFAVYDASGLYKFDWFLGAVKGPPDRILNIHAGFDETSKGLRMLFPEAKIEVFDFYSAERNTEPSIARARAANAARVAKEGAVVTPACVDITGWNLENNSQDIAHLFMSAHELRKREDRETLFREVHRVLKDDGELIVVEHLRDVVNFLAFGPGFLHFYPRSEWLRLAKVCGFRVRKEKSIAGFVRVFYLCKT